MIGVKEIASAFGVDPEGLELVTKESGMNIKEIARKFVAEKGAWGSMPYDKQVEVLVEFAAEVQRQNEPVITLTGIDEYGPILEWSEHWVDFEIGEKFYVRLAADSGDSRTKQQWELDGKVEMGQLLADSKNKKTSDSEAEGKLALDINAEREKVAEACALKLESEANTLASTCGYEDMGGLSFGRGEHAEAKMDRYNELLELAEAIRSGEWRRFVNNDSAGKEVK